MSLSHWLSRYYQRVPVLNLERISSSDLNELRPLYEDNLALNLSFLKTFSVQRACFAWRYMSAESLLGAVWFSAFDESADLVDIRVMVGARRQGFGRDMLEKALTLLYRRGITKVTLEVRASNVAAIALYHEFGFALIDQRRNYYSQNYLRPVEDALVMQLSLK